ncbi:hypothetical protein EYC84_004681 [Monilinia fructicola]|uniref:Uncharacterized protein n=1 Tax=Monilinia fructicola TaxID=38448 RepID=A0A5M9K418_MONFR|nr:hypothetical protein EYC84_004681 [Monilinia fructicola]
MYSVQQIRLLHSFPAQQDLRHFGQTHIRHFHLSNFFFYSIKTFSGLCAWRRLFIVSNTQYSTVCECFGDSIQIPKMKRFHTTLFLLLTLQLHLSCQLYLIVATSSLIFHSINSIRYFESSVRSACIFSYFILTCDGILLQTRRFFFSL